MFCANSNSGYLALIIVFFDKTNKYNKIIFAFGKGMTFFEDKIKNYQFVIKFHLKSSSNTKFSQHCNDITVTSKRPPKMQIPQALFSLEVELQIARAIYTFVRAAVVKRHIYWWVKIDL